MKPVVSDQNGNVLSFPKNLGWLLRHAHLVVRVTIHRERDGSALLCATLADGRVYTSPFASTSIAERWTLRPSLAHAERVLLNSAY